MLNKLPTWVLILLPGILLFPAWPPLPVFFLLFAGFVPLFALADRYTDQRRWLYFMSLYSSIFFWNLVITWWVWNSTAWGAMVMLICNPLLMMIPWMLARFSRRWVSDRNSKLLLVLFWLLFEFVHMRWDLSWPWLTLGNGFANATWFVQWYEFTGVLGGSALVLFVNLCLFRYLTSRNSVHYKRAMIAIFLAAVFSLVLQLLPHSGKQSKTLNVVLLQPSFDPWNEKFTRNPADMIAEMTEISETAVDSTTELLVWPETSLVDNIDVQSAEQDYQIQLLQRIRQKYPRLDILTGADMQQMYENCTARPNSTARPTGDASTWWDAYNSAIYLDSGPIQCYHKSKLVPGTEQMPLTNWFPAINDLAVKLDENSMTGSLGRSDSVVLFGPHRVIPAICYESIYGDWLARFARSGGQLIAVITNDAWWGKTPGYKQHLAYARLRAIEQRKWVVRSANTGTSCFIDPKGKVLDASEWYEKTALRRTVSLNSTKTLYTQIGDTGFVLAISILIIIAIITESKKQRKAAINRSEQSPDK